MITCDNEGCGSEAGWGVFIVGADIAGKEIVEGDTHIRVCNDCRDIVTVDVVMNDHQYELLCESFVAEKKAPPPRECLKIELRMLARLS